MADPIPTRHDREHAMLSAAAAPFPIALTSFVGRRREMAAILTILRREDVRLVTLTGPGGVGKTRLALRVAEDMRDASPDGIHFIPLATVTDYTLVLSTVAKALGLQPNDDSPLVEQMRRRLRSLQALLILDNLEQVSRAAPDLTAMLAACPTITILATSRTLLRVSGENGYAVPPLTLPTLPPRYRRQGNQEIRDLVATSEAVQLFVERTRSVDPGLALTGANAADIADICCRLDGLPLAIELAAARGNTLTPAELVARLERRLPMLIAGPVDQPPRLRTMRDAIAWGYVLLSPDEQAMLHHLAIFAGGFTLAAAEAVGEGESASVLDLVASLVDHGLLRRDLAEQGTAARFTMLETIREFALERLDASGDAEELRRRHAGWCLEFVAGIQRRGGLSQGRWLAAVEAEHPNLRAALRWLLDQGDVADALRLSGLLAEFWLRHGHLTEGSAWIEETLAADRGNASGVRATALVGLNMLLWPRNQFERAEGVLAEAEVIARAADDERAFAYVRLHQGYLAAFRGDPDLAKARGEETAAYFGGLPDFIHLNGALWLLARSALVRNDDDLAREHYGRLMETARGWGDEISLANGHLGLAILAERRDEPRVALANFAQVAAMCTSYDDTWAACLGLDGAAAAAVALDQTPIAARLLGAAEALRQHVGGEPVSPFVGERPSHERTAAAARQTLGHDAYEAAFAAGATLTLEEAVAEALALDDRASRPDALNDMLTAREREVLRWLANGHTDKEIAAAIGITRRTASNHVAAILAKLGVQTRSAAVALAVRQHLV